ncbi:MAG TPA: hypothetical protein VH914_08530 [Acidimicrobiia bacterium]|jgi:hypothetical protein|nr:hypothetical protein [Acidimicrobiia bacterium]
MKRIRAFGAFWYDFVVGDDWRLAVVSAAALGLCGLLAHHGVPAWWLVPVAVAVALTLTLVRLVPIESGVGDTVPANKPPDAEVEA